MEDLSFEESLDKLEEIVKKLETGEVPLDDAMQWIWLKYVMKN